MQRPTWATEYFIKRFWRIAPLYYCIMAATILWAVMKSRTWTVDIQTLLLNLTFTFGFAPWKGIVWAGWTVGVEMLFYAILPVLLLTVRTTSATLVLVFVSLLVSYFLRSALDVHYEYTLSQHGYNWGYYSFGSNLCFFAMGIYAFRLNQHQRADSVKMRWVIPMFSMILLGILMFTELDRPLMGLGRVDLMLWGLGFAALCIWQSTRPSRWSANKFFEYVGERSYSVYLLHPMVIVLLRSPLRCIYDTLNPSLGPYVYFICAVLVLVPLLVLSELTYQLIEVPGIRFGRRINSRIRMGARASEPAGSG